MIANDQELNVALDRLAKFQRQVSHLRTSSTLRVVLLVPKLRLGTPSPEAPLRSPAHNRSTSLLPIRYSLLPPHFTLRTTSSVSTLSRSSSAPRASSPPIYYPFRKTIVLEGEGVRLRAR